MHRWNIQYCMHMCVCVFQLLTKNSVQKPYTRFHVVNSSYSLLLAITQRRVAPYITNENQKKCFDSNFTRLPPPKNDVILFICWSWRNSSNLYVYFWQTFETFDVCWCWSARILKQTNLFQSAVIVITLFGRVSVFIEKNDVCSCAMCTVWRYGFGFAVCQTLYSVAFRMTSLVWCCETMRSYKISSWYRIAVNALAMKTIVFRMKWHLSN